MSKYCSGCSYYDYLMGEGLRCLNPKLCINGSAKDIIKRESPKMIYEYLPRTLEIQTIEELSELIQAISKLYRYGFEEKTCNDIYEELADAYLMLDIFKARYGICEDIIDKNKEFKLKRLKQRIKEDLEKTGGSL